MRKGYWDIQNGIKISLKSVFSKIRVIYNHDRKI